MADSNRQLHIDIISQERRLLTETADQLSAPSVLGEVTILPGHIPLFTRLEDGIVRFKKDGKERELAIFGGFMDVGPGNRITVLADTAVLAEDVNQARAEAAKQKAQIAMKQKGSEVEFKQAEIALRRALLELKVARRRKTSTNPSTESTT